MARRKDGRVNLEEYERFMPGATVNIGGKKLQFCIPNKQVAWRVSTMFTKEPDTIAWIQGMAPGEVFLDVGANIGLYSLYAALRGLRVYAFEPEAQNYALLCRNICVNKLEVHAYAVALSDKFAVDELYLSGLAAGGSCHSFGQSTNFKGENAEFPFRQGCMSCRIDELPFVPQHIKIDVDGLEHKVIAGAVRTLQHIKSVLVELNRNLPAHLVLFEILSDMGFKTDDAQMETALRKEGPFTNVGNVIFTR